MIQNILKGSSQVVRDRIKELQNQQNRVVELYKVGGITRDIANIELYKINSKINRVFKLYSIITSMRVKIQTVSII